MEGGMGGKRERGRGSSKGRDREIGRVVVHFGHFLWNQVTPTPTASSPYHYIGKCVHVLCISSQQVITFSKW